MKGQQEKMSSLVSGHSSLPPEDLKLEQTQSYKHWGYITRLSEVMYFQVLQYCTVKKK